jgi:hypothetical protein
MAEAPNARASARSGEVAAMHVEATAGVPLRAPRRPGASGGWTAPARAGGLRHQSMYSNRITALVTPEVERAISVATAASARFTSPIR